MRHAAALFASMHKWCNARININSFRDVSTSAFIAINPICEVDFIVVVCRYIFHESSVFLLYNSLAYHLTFSFQY